ncbi:NAD(P)-dependent oxidoreductase [Agrobacterium larrymoorei]|uniref:NAD(P)H-binding protein n=1 Tax=Agrobacterium larrymoorei TaxID=160699 RepID=A0A4D7E1D7_9HYPH|nr:NAD(P)H-binding protein [Agrobacterium larrymoorei]QCJ01045.1 NAD-dependent epimerase/dehydratase family protein [Agrobacterium larrymoorei]QYA10409.1 NAD(P)H-binding protein [Agrobacterium larrymoorei]
MNVTLFGPTGKTGPYLIDEALKRGFEVTVFARSSTPFQDDRVHVVRGDLSDSAVLREAVRGADAVLSALGPSKTPHPRHLPITRATQAVISAMKEENVTRLIAISTGTRTAGTTVSPNSRMELATMSFGIPPRSTCPMNRSIRSVARRSRILGATSCGLPTISAPRGSAALSMSERSTCQPRPPLVFGER